MHITCADSGYRQCMCVQTVARTEGCIETVPFPCLFIVGFLIVHIHTARRQKRIIFWSLLSATWDFFCSSYLMPTKEKKTKAQIAAAASAGSRSKKKVSA